MITIDIEKKLKELARRVRRLADGLESLETVTLNAIEEVEAVLDVAEPIVELESIPMDIPEIIEEEPVEIKHSSVVISIITALETNVENLENNVGNREDNIEILGRNLENLISVYGESEGLKELIEASKLLIRDEVKVLDGEVITLVERIKEDNGQVVNMEQLINILGMKRWKQLKSSTYTPKERSIIRANYEQIKKHYS